MKSILTLVAIVSVTILLSNCSPKIAKNTASTNASNRATNSNVQDAKAPEEKVTQQKTDEEVARMKKAEMANTYIPENITLDEYSQGKQVWSNTCNKCHELYAPSTRTIASWKKIMTTMSVQAKLDAQTANAVTGYLIKNAKN